LTHGQNLDLAHDILDANFGTTHPYVWAMHDPPAADGASQPHVHVLWSARSLDGIAVSRAILQAVECPASERGGARKDPALNHFGSVKAARVLYADIVNAHLEHHGHQARLHPDRLLDRGFAASQNPSSSRLIPTG